jgi:3-hydroxybutyryl-CoA dehydratase
MRGAMMQVGDVTAWERTFTVEDVLLFGQLSGDQGSHHVRLDEQGRLMVQGLLTATLPTKLGGDINYIARNMTFEFLRPVFTGDTIRCEMTVAHLEQADERIRMNAECVCRNQHGKEVLLAHVQGIIREPVD